MTAEISDNVLPRTSGSSDALPRVSLKKAIELPKHMPGLDGIRGLAVVLILFCHCMQRPYLLSNSIDTVYSSHIDKLILMAARFSWSGVDLFFVLSGFLITGILYDAKGRDRFFTNFYARRTVRIFPLYYVFLIIFLVIWPHLPAALNYNFGSINNGKIWYWFYLSNYPQGVVEQAGHPTDYIVHVSWSLAIEEQFYLFWPLLVYLFRREAMLKICVGIFFGSLLLRGMSLTQGWYLDAMNWTPTRLDGLATGAAIALIARGPRGVGVLVKPAKFIGPIAAILFWMMTLLMAHMGYHRGIGQSPGYVLCGTSLLSLMFGSLLLWAAISEKGTIGHRIFNNAILQSFGKYSYGVYLLHLPILILVADYLFRPDMLKLGNTTLPGLIVFFAITWGLSLLAAVISWNVLEKHCLKLKAFFPMEKKAASAAAWEGADVADAEPLSRRPESAA